MPTLTITAANAVYMLSIASIFPIPQRLQGFAVDAAFDTEPADTAEVQLGVDGFVAGGWIPRLTTQTITLLASSPSFPIFEQWVYQQDATQTLFLAQATITLPATGTKYFLPNGSLTRYPALPNARRVLQQRQFTIQWGWPITGAPA